MNDANEVTFDFGDGGSGGDDAAAPDFTGQVPLGACPKCGARVFELPQAYVCENAVGPEKSCTFRSGRIILQRPVERAQMEKLLASGKTDLLQFVSARTRRGFSAFLIRQPDGKIGFEFEAKGPPGAKGARAARGGAALRVLGLHPADKRPVELYAGRYGPYVKHGDVNATLPDRDAVETLTLDAAVALLSEKAGAPPAKKSAARTPRKREAAADKVAEPKAPAVKTARAKAAATATEGKIAAKSGTKAGPAAKKTTARTPAGPAAKKKTTVRKK